MSKNNAYTNIDLLFIFPPYYVFWKTDFPIFPLGMGHMVSYLKKGNIISKIYHADILQPEKIKMNTIDRYLSKIFPYLPDSWSLEAWSSYYSKINNTADNPVWNDMEVAIKKTDPKIVGIFATVITIPAAINAANIVKNIFPDIKVVIGGPAAATCHNELILNDSVDFLVIGEGEKTILELAVYLLGRKGKLPSLRDINGIMFKENREIIRTAPRALIENLDEIPWIDRDSMFVIDINREIKPIHQNMDILSSRGCPYPCKFCAGSAVWGSKKTRFRSIDNIIDELIYLKSRYGQNYFEFWDDLFTANRKRTVELCEKIIKRRLDIEWVCMVRLDTIDADLLGIMKKAGCTEIQIGIESGSDRVLSHMGKTITVDMIRKQVPVIKQLGIDLAIFLMVGMPTETKEEIEDTLKLVRKIGPEWVHIGIFNPYPGSKFNAELNEKGIIGKNVMERFTWHPYKSYTGTMSDPEFMDIGMRALKFAYKYNTRPKYLIKTICKKVKKATVAMLNEGIDRFLFFKGGRA